MMVCQSALSRLISFHAYYTSSGLNKEGVDQHEDPILKVKIQFIVEIHVDSRSSHIVTQRTVTQRLMAAKPADL